MGWRHWQLMLPCHGRTSRLSCKVTWGPLLPIPWRVSCEHSHTRPTTVPAFCAGPRFVPGCRACCPRVSCMLCGVACTCAWSCPDGCNRLHASNVTTAFVAAHQSSEAWCCCCGCRSAVGLLLIMKEPGVTNIHAKCLEHTSISMHPLFLPSAS